MLVAFAKSVQGESHKRRENLPENLELGRKFPCQDKSFAQRDVASIDGSHFDFIAVSDGHGGAAYFRSDVGAGFAIEVLKDILVRNMPRIVELASSNDYEKIKTQLALGITKRWREKIAIHLTENPITEQEYNYLEAENSAAAQKYREGNDLNAIYGCTLIAYFSTSAFWYALQIGDGDFSLSYDGKTFELPMPEDKDCFLNQTTSLCDKTASEEFRYCYGEKAPLAAFCSSDGIANSFKDIDSLKDKFYLPIYNLFDNTEFPQCKKDCANSDCDIKCHLRLVCEEIFSFLPILSKKGSGDDISISGIVDVNIERVLAIRYFIRGMKNLGIQSGNTAGLKLLKKAADLGYEKAQFEYGRLCYEKSAQHKIFGQQLLNKSQKYLEEAAESGFQEASVLLKQIADSVQSKLDNLSETLAEKISGEF